MFVSREQYAKVLQDNEGRVCWRSSGGPGVVVHEWREVDSGRLLLREVQGVAGSTYWIDGALMEKKSLDYGGGGGLV